MPYDEDEIGESRRGEERRGKRPIDIAARRRRLIVKRKLEEAFKNNDVEMFKEMLISDVGLTPGTPEYDRLVKIWYSQRGRS
jgi:hypothetical protein